MNGIWVVEGRVMGKWQRGLAGFLLAVLIILSGSNSAEAVPAPEAIQWQAAPVPFVESLYQGVLGRNPRTAADWQTVDARAQLLANRQATHLQLFWAFINSDEYRASRWARQKREYNIYLNQKRVELPTGGWYFCNCYFFAKFAHATEFIKIVNVSPYSYGIAAALTRYHALIDPDTCPHSNCRGGGRPGNSRNTRRPPVNPPGSSTGQMVSHNGCSCEDWDSDGRYGVVLNGNVLRSNIGTYETCMRHAATLSQCGSQDSIVSHNACTCEDWDSDGRYGVVLNGNVLRSNIGTYEKCMRHAVTLNQCRAGSPVGHSGWAGSYKVKSHHKTGPSRGGRYSSRFTVTVRPDGGCFVVWGNKRWDQCTISGNSLRFRGKHSSKERDGSMVWQFVQQGDGSVSGTFNGTIRGQSASGTYTGNRSGN